MLLLSITSQECKVQLRRPLSFSEQNDVQRLVHILYVSHSCTLSLFLRVNLALAYTELTEELGKLQALSAKQTEILRKASQEQASPGTEQASTF